MAATGVSLSGTIAAGISEQEEGTRQARRVSDLLLQFLEQQEVSVTQLSRQLGWSKAVVHRILKSLESRKLVVGDKISRVYRLGPAAIALGTQALGECDLRRSALPLLWRLQRETEETSTVAILVGFARVHLDQVLSPRDVRMTVELGRPFPLHAGATGKAMLAFAPDRTLDGVLAGRLASITPRTVVDPRALKAELEQIRRTGVAVSFGERQPDAASVASPVLHRSGETVGAITVCGPASRFDRAIVERLSLAVQAAAAEVTKTLREQESETAGDPSA